MKIDKSGSFWYKTEEDCTGDYRIIYFRNSHWVKQFGLVGYDYSWSNGNIDNFVLEEYYV